MLSGGAFPSRDPLSVVGHAELPQEILPSDCPNHGSMRYIECEENRMAALQVGQAAPDFDVPALVGGIKQRFRLRDCRGRNNLVIAFHPLNWTPV